MSRPRSRSPLYSRIPTHHSGRADGLFDDQIHSSVQSDAWRNTEYENKAESNTQWNKDSYQGEQHVDHWAKFIDAIEHAQKGEVSSMSRFHIEGDEERPPYSPRRLPRERLPSPDHARFHMDEHYGMPGSQGWNRNNDSDNLDRHEHISQQNHRESRNRSYPRHSEAKRYDQMEYGLHKAEHSNNERGLFSERSSKSDYREHHLSSERFKDLGQQDAYSEHHRGVSPRRAPVIVEHDHGISKRQPRSRDPPRMSGRPRSRDPPRRSEPQRNRGPNQDRRDQDHHSHTLQGRHNRAPSSNVREESRNQYLSYGRESQMRDRSRYMDESQVRDRSRYMDESQVRDRSRHMDESQVRDRSRHMDESQVRDRSRHMDESQVGDRSRHMDRSRMESLSRGLEGQREMELDDTDLRSDRSHRERDHEWQDERPQGNNGRMMEQEGILQRAPYQRNPKTNAGPVPRTDFSEQETLKIKVDMSRPIGQSSHLGYSSDRQLSLDLVNVGRQRLDFLPMLEHSGTYRESAVHSGTFAQEIITLVHQVKENYFKGQGITLNERFANEQYYSLQDEFKEEEDEEMQSVGPIMNRLGMPLSETQIFCNIGAEPLQRRQPAPDPGDLRYDLERRRQQRLEGVKITIAGGSFTQMAPESQESELPYVNEDPDQSEGTFGWSEQPPEQPRQWNGPRQRVAAPNRQNFNPRGNSSRNNRPRGRRT